MTATRSGKYVLSIDQGTTSSRAILFDDKAQPLVTAAEPLKQHYPAPGWVEHDADEIWAAVLKVCKKVLTGIDAAEVAAIGITNQRETTVLWDRLTGEPLNKAIVWQDRRTAQMLQEMRSPDFEAEVAARTGLLLDPYFSASKLAWLFANRPEFRARAVSGNICFGTIDSWLIFKLTGGRVHATDATNASRTMLFDINTGRWDSRLCNKFQITDAVLPKVRNCQDDYGVARARHLGGEIPILGVAGDQQAAAYGQACFEPGMIKATFGTGCFVLANTGTRKITSQNRMLSTIAYQLDGQRTYALEGAIFMAGATLAWLRDGLGLFKELAESEAMAAQAATDSGVYLVPAFTGLGAPHWDADARGAILGLTRGADRNDIVRAGLESVAYQTRDLLEAISSDMEQAGENGALELRVDGGMTVNRWLMQCLADILGGPVEVAAVSEATALGAAYHAGQRAGLYGTQAELAKAWQAARYFEPQMSADERERKYDGWLAAVARVRSTQAEAEAEPI